jgi:hypothetical protein
MPDPHHDRRWLILCVIGIAQLLVVLDVTIVNIALPSAQQDLGFSDDNRQWIITAYALAFGSLLLLGGRIADLFGRKWTFIAGLLGFAGASALGGAGHWFGLLVGARALHVLETSAVPTRGVVHATVVHGGRGERDPGGEHVPGAQVPVVDILVPGDPPRIVRVLDEHIAAEGENVVTQEGSHSIGEPPIAHEVVERGKEQVALLIPHHLRATVVRRWQSGRGQGQNVDGRHECFPLLEYVQSDQESVARERLDLAG